MKRASATVRDTIRGLAFEFVLALATLTLWPILDERRQGTAANRSRAMVFFPVVGFALGVILAVIDRADGLLLGPAARSFATLVAGATISLCLTNRGVADSFEAIRRRGRQASTGLARIGPLAALAMLAVFAFEVWCLSRIAGDSGRAGALVMAMTLSRWAIVPVGYGLKPLEHWGLGIPFEGGISFREFSATSAVALGLTMALYQNVGLAVIVGVALTILALRLLLSRRMSGASGYTLAGGCATVEVVVLAVMAALRV